MASPQLHPWREWQSDRSRDRLRRPCPILGHLGCSRGSRFVLPSREALFFCLSKLLTKTGLKTRVDLICHNGLFWEAFCDSSWIQKGKENGCEKRPRPSRSWGMVKPIAVMSILSVAIFSFQGYTSISTIDPSYLYIHSTAPARSRRVQQHHPRHELRPRNPHVNPIQRQTIATARFIHGANGDHEILCFGVSSRKLP